MLLMLRCFPRNQQRLPNQGEAGLYNLIARAMLVLEFYCHFAIVRDHIPALCRSPEVKVIETFFDICMFR